MQLTEKQSMKLNSLTDYYNSYSTAIHEENVITQDKLIAILKECKWNIYHATNKAILLHDLVVKENNRLANLPKNVVKPSDNQGHDEIWSEFYNCPSCGSATLCADHRDNYCSRCGIKVDWSEIDKL